MTLRPSLTLIFLTQILGAGLSLAGSSNVAGRWSVEITFENGETRALRFEARDAGAGSFLLMDPRSHVWGAGGPFAAKWTQSENSVVTFSGPVEFLIGNIGRDAGTMVLKGKIGIAGAITGEAKFFPLGQDANDPKAKPSKSGTFRATRVIDSQSSKSSTP